MISPSGRYLGWAGRNTSCGHHHHHSLGSPASPLPARHLHYLHSIYTVSTQYLHSIYTNIYTVSTQYLHNIYIVSTQYIYTLSTQFAHLLAPCQHVTNTRDPGFLSALCSVLQFYLMYFELLYTQYLKKVFPWNACPQKNNINKVIVEAPYFLLVLKIPMYIKVNIDELYPRVSRQRCRGNDR